MKKFKCLAVLLLLFFLVGCVGMDKLSSVVPGGKKDAGAVNVSDASVKFKGLVYGATKLLIESIRDIKLAVGDKEDAVKMTALLKELEEAREANDNEAMKKIFKEVNNAAESIKDVKLEQKATSREAKKYIGTAFLYTGTALWLDKKAIDYAKILIDKLPGEIRSNPLKASNYTSTLSLAKIVVQETPKQVTSLGQIVTQLGNYASVNGLPTPSGSETKALIKKEVPEVKESDTEDL